MSPTIAVEELRIGMYVHLDGGWLSHPFPLSSFRIASDEQIGKLRGLGLTRVRWMPDKSDNDGAPAAAAAAAVAAAAAAAAPQRSAAELAAAARSEWVAAQREAARLCERQFGEAAKAWRATSDSVAAEPQRAGRTGQALAQAMLDQILAAPEVGIRLVAGGGDRAAAHALNVAVVSLLIGRTLGFAADEMLELGVGALLHDVGKIDIAERLRHVDEGSTGADLAAYRDHVAKGVLQGQRMQLSEGALAVLAQHHEHADGSGFPQRIASERISVGARIVALVNRYDNLCNPASRAQALTPHEALATLFAQGRSKFDATVLNTFIRMMGVYPAGSLVQLTDDRFALVVGANSSRPLKPRVLVHGQPRGLVHGQPRGLVQGQPRGLVHDQPRGSTQAGAGAELIDLETLPDLGIRRSLAAAKLPAAALQALDPRPRVNYYFEPLARQRRPEALGA